MSRGLQRENKPPKLKRSICAGLGLKASLALIQIYAIVTADK